ncbi:ABC transporter permease [Paenibacillus sp. L3-i20]|uniref:ABC transporter permease n=1 Tax=Paenibacillus sp. L3-i20 TaxID=2905833 RepID=UPI001EE02CC9|nr:ABC transporter permease [Paenibacillus sp. L3-i20]GKU77302.1 ABC transporter permease [Paenibacillus sp. L3-i20]
MYNLIKAELFKLRKDRVFRTMILIIAILSLVYPLLYYFDNLSQGSPQMTGVQFLFNFITGNTLIVKFSIAVLAGFFISSEYSTGVMKTIASSGNVRAKLYIAKLIGFSLGAMILSLVFPIVSTLEVSLLSGFGHLPEGAEASFIPRAIGLTLLFTVAFASIGALFTVVFTDSGKTIGFSLIFFLMIDTVLVGLGKKIAFFSTLYDYSIFKLVGYIGQTSIDSGDIPKLLIVPLVTIVVSGLLGILVFRRKEIK